MQDQQADLEWRDSGVPVSNRFDDPYFSIDNGLEETRHVFLSGNDLPARFQDGFRIAEWGFGTGLGFLTAIEAWIKSGVQGHLHFTSFEAFPMTAPEMARALSAFPELNELAEPLIQLWAEKTQPVQYAPNITLEVKLGDARQTLPEWNDKADAWFLDGFSPAKNPELWAPELMQSVADHTTRTGTAATYTAAGFVRRGLSDAGFQVERIAGYGRKRHMTVAKFGIDTE
jgi:tRNA U34 5-methylaminomethyl-2-thiouridine-forming methyltransferase MnmC